MTEEEINKKAEKHCDEVLCNTHEKCNEVIKCRDWRSRRAGFFCGYEQALKDFEKENAELKEKLGNYQKGMFDEIEKRDKQLTKAKELLKKIYNFEYGIEADFPKFDLVKWSIETRDFLKDSEVEK